MCADPGIYEKNNYSTLLSLQKNSTVVGSTFTISCPENYFLSDGVEFVCTSDGAWSSAPDLCTPHQSREVLNSERLCACGGL